jgi:hypothetical protein
VGAGGRGTPVGARTGPRRGAGRGRRGEARSAMCPCERSEWLGRAA